MNPRPDPFDFDHLTKAAIAAEQSLLGTCIMHPQAMAAVAGLVEPEQFCDPVHVSLWEGMIALAADGRPVTPATLIAKLGNNDIGGVTLSVYIAQCCTETTCPPAYIADYAKQVREYAALRTIVARAEDARAAALSPGSSPREIVASLMQELDNARAALDPRITVCRPAADVVVSVVDRMAGIIQGTVSDQAISTGIGDLDRRLNGGWRPGQLIIIAGRPGMGKTTIAASCARQSAKAGHCGVFYSLEMPADQIGARLIADQAFTSSDPLLANMVFQRDITDRHADMAARAAKAIETLPLYVDESSSMTVGEIGARTRSMADRAARAGKRLEFIMVDYLKFVRASERYRGQRHYEVGEISAGLKSLAKDMGIAVILLAQLNREVEKRQDKRPELADLRESGDLEADADAVLLLFREEYYLANDPRVETEPALQARLSACHNKLEVIIAKQRMGCTGSVDLFCHPGASAVRDGRFY